MSSKKGCHRPKKTNIDRKFTKVTRHGLDPSKIQMALEIAEAITPVKSPSVPGVASTPRLGLGSMFSATSHSLAPNSLATSTPDQGRKVSAEVVEEDNNLNNTAGSNAFSADGSSWTFEPVARLWYNAFPNYLLKR